MSADSMRRAGEIAMGAFQNDAKRAADVHRFHQVIIAALNETHDDKGEQDSLALFEGIAHVLAQLVGGFDDPDARLGYLHFVVNRAEWLMDVYRAEDNVAQHREVSRSS